MLAHSKAKMQSVETFQAARTLLARRDSGMCTQVTLKLTSMENIRVTIEEFKVLGKELADKVKEMIHAGNIRRIIIRDEHGHTFMEIPLTVAAVGAIAAPVVAAVSAIAAH